MTGRPSEPCDCLIVGGGPAGATMAYLLARSGLHVVLVDDGRARNSGPYETLLPESFDLLDRVGLVGVVQGAGAPDPMRHGAIWGNDELRWRNSGDASGLLLERPAFDRALRRRAAEAGAVIHEASRVQAGPARPDEGLCVVGAHEVTRWYSPVVVASAIGRSARADAPAELLAGPPTIACTFVGEVDPAAPRVAVVEAVATGWTWFQSPRAGRATAAVLLDAVGAAGQTLAHRARAALTACRGPAAMLANAPLRHAVVATARCIDRDGDVLRLGDAAAAIDPLASQGVEKALAAADHAAAAVRTLCARPSMRAEAIDEHRRWERGLWRAHQERSDAFHRTETRFAESAFWRARRGSESSPRPVADDDVLYVVGPDVREALCLRRVGGAFERCPGAERGGERLTHLGFVPIRPLLSAVARPITLRGAMAAVGADPSCFVLPPAAVHAALHDLVRRGWLTRAANATNIR